ncbi:preprotein translocase subunit YajC [Streptococcus sp. DD13]|uniref:preprotein translocase subunit YajC n=1 Tax=Streptococcus sp. DD13 TaxID=1777881 RepID=UPI00079AC115|nr:preprotein translocase subunit YajC [Streptococcus sp. DD13]KXT77747.1 Preprotein translocase subunit YajC [Streptococcus sp. DD13]
MQGLLFPLILVVMLVVMIFSQRRQARQQQERLSKIKKGDEIITIGGLHGVIDEIDDQTFVLDCDGVYLTFERGAIRRTVTKVEAEPVGAIEIAEAE